MAFLGLHILRVSRRLSDLLVTVSAARALARLELRAVRRVADRYYTKIGGQNFSVSLVRKLILKIAYFRAREHPRPKRLIGVRDAPRLVADAAKAAGLAERRLEKLSREVVTSDAYGMGKVFGHRLIGVPGLLLSREMTIGALNFYVLLLVVRKAPVSGSVFGLRNREQFSLFSSR